MLRLLVEDHGRFQVRPNAAFGLESFRQNCAIERQAMWASRKMAARFNNNGPGYRQLSNLSALEIFRPNSGQIGQTMLAFCDRKPHYSIGIVHERARKLLMTEGRPMFLAFLLRRLDGFLIARRRLRGVARIGGFVQSLLESLVFSFQVGDSLAQRFEFRQQRLDQWGKFLARQ